MNQPPLIRHRPPAIPEWAEAVGLSYISWPLDEWRWRPTVGQRVAVGVNEWFDGVDTLHLLWVHPEVFFNGWSFEASEYLHSLRIVKVRPVDIPKSKDGRYEALVDILAVIDPWEVAGHTPKEVGSLDRISPTRGVTAIVSSGDRTVVYRCDDSDQTFQYYL